MSFLPRGTESPETVDPAEMEQVTRTLIAYCLRRRVELKAYQDLTDRYASMMKSRGRMAVKSPWEAKAMHIMTQEVLLFANDTRLSDGKAAPKLTFKPDLNSVQNARILQYAFCEEIDNSPVYWWSEDMHRTATAAKLPSHVISNTVLPQHRLFMLFEEPLPIEVAIDGDDNYQDGSVYWMFLRAEDDQLQMVLCYITERNGESIFVVDVSGIKFGTRFPGEEARHNQDMWTIALQMLAFVNSPFVAVDGEPVHRDIRKHIGPQVTSEDARNPKINVVRLRRRTASSLPPPSQDADAPLGRKRGKNGHWWVSPHNRAQWYPSEQAHHVKWIAAYIKGDTSKPLMERVYKVAR